MILLPNRLEVNHGGGWTAAMKQAWQPRVTSSVWLHSCDRFVDSLASTDALNHPYDPETDPDQSLAMLSAAVLDLSYFTLKAPEVPVVTVSTVICGRKMGRSANTAVSPVGKDAK